MAPARQATRERVGRHPGEIAVRLINSKRPCEIRTLQRHCVQCRYRHQTADWFEAHFDELRPAIEGKRKALTAYRRTCRSSGIPTAKSSRPTYKLVID